MLTYTGSRYDIATEKQTCGVLLPYFGAYSGLPPAGVLRFAIFATHTTAQLDRLLAELRTVL